MAGRKKRWGAGSFDYQVSLLGERLNEALASADEAYWRTIGKVFREVPEEEELRHSESSQLDAAQENAVFDWLLRVHPEPELVVALRKIFGKPMTPEQRKAWDEKLRRWGMI